MCGLSVYRVPPYRLIFIAIFSLTTGKISPTIGAPPDVSGFSYQPSWSFFAMDNSLDIFDDVKDGAEGLSAVGIHAGFPNPAAERDHRRPTLSLDRLLVPRPSSTYFFRIQGHQWSDQGINDGDVAIVDRTPQAAPHDMIVAWQDDFVLRRYGSLPPTVQIWGVVTAVVHRYRAGRSA
jgi:hypothetical protein